MYMLNRELGHKNCANEFWKKFSCLCIYAVIDGGCEREITEQKLLDGINVCYLINWKAQNNTQ